MKIPTIVVSPQRTKPDRTGFPTLSWSMLLVPNMVLCLAELRKEEGAQPVSDSRSGGGDPELNIFCQEKYLKWVCSQSFAENGLHSFNDKISLEKTIQYEITSRSTNVLINPI